MPDPRDLLRTSTFCSMVHVIQKLTAEVAPELARKGSGTILYLLLGQLLLTPDLCPAELARAAHLSPQRVGDLLRRAESDGLVERTGERGRGRRTQLRIADAGLRVLEEGWPVVHGAGADRLTGTQHRQMQALLDRLRADPADEADVVVLVDADGNDAGTADRLGVHGTDTPLHRAFSTHLVDAAGRVLLTRRALHKATWPGVWTNAACGHLRPGEDALAAARRRVPEELGTAATDLRMALPGFAYRAVDASGIVENEVCPVLVGYVDAAALQPDPDEVCEVAWLEWAHVRRLAAATPQLLSPWSVLQIDALGDAPWGIA